MEQFADNILTMTTANNEQYQCIVPPENDPNAQNVLSYDGPSANKLMEPVLKGGSCTLRASIKNYPLPPEQSSQSHITFNLGCQTTKVYVY